MQFDLIIQARMGSSRLPGKSAIEIKQRTILGHLVDSLKYWLPEHKIIIATSHLPENSYIREFGKSENIKVYSGSEDNVAERFKTILENSSNGYFIRLNGDSPLFDARTLKERLSNIEVIKSHDLSTTVGPNGFPSGQNFEIMKKSLYLSCYQNFENQVHYEHVTKFFYENANSFAIQHIPFNYIGKNYDFTVDTEQDLAKIKRFFDHLDRPHYHYSLEEKCDFYRTLFNSV